MSQCPYCFKNDYWNRFLQVIFFVNAKIVKYSIKIKTLKVGVYFSFILCTFIFNWYSYLLTMRKKSYPSNLAIIPARGGSKRLKNKNKLLLFGKPLVRHTVQAALMSNKITDVLVSSDSDDILDIACLEENIIRHKRDDSLATDTSTALELVNNIVENSSKEYDFITLMLPTCPLRTHQHIDTAFDLISGEDDGVISVTTYNFPIELKVTTDGEYIKLSDDSPLITGNTHHKTINQHLDQTEVSI